MILEFIMDLLLSLASWVAGVLPRIPLGPLAPGGSFWTSVRELARRMGWVSVLLPWNEVGVGALFLVSSAVIALSFFVLGFILRMLRVVQ